MGALTICALAMAALAGEVTATRPLPRGTVIAADMVAGGDEADLADVLGRQLVRPVFEGKPVTASDLRAPDLVARQDAVTVRFARPALTLDLPGRALRAGGMGASVTVLIEGRRRPLQAVVTGPGLVEVRR